MPEPASAVVDPELPELPLEPEAPLEPEPPSFVVAPEVPEASDDPPASFEPELPPDPEVPDVRTRCTEPVLDGVLVVKQARVRGRSVSAKPAALAGAAAAEP